MQAAPRKIVDQFADEYAGKEKGFSAKEITQYFSNYSNMVKPYEHYGFKPTRREFFIDSLYALLPKEQYYTLTDLCLNPPKMKYAIPNEETRSALNTSLHSFLNKIPIGLCYSELREHIYREDWFTAYNRIKSNPAAAITAARTLLETVFKTIISDRKETPDDPSKLSKLLKQTQKLLNFDKAKLQEEHKILNGLTNIINGVAGLSNKAGDRHGLIKGMSIDDPCIANTVVNACGTVGLFFIELHLFTPAKIKSKVNKIKEIKPTYEIFTDKIFNRIKKGRNKSAI